MRRDPPQNLVKAGELLKDVLPFRPPSHVVNRLIEAAEDIKERPPDDIAFQHSVLCQTSLPYRSTPQRRWEAQNGKVVLLVEAGMAYHPTKKQWVELPLPFGPKARLILMYLNSEAIRTKTPIVDVGDSMTAFLRQLQNGRDPNGDEIQKFKQQLAALAQAKISMAQTAEILDQTEPGGTPHGNLGIVKFINLWFPKNPNQRVIWPEYLELTMDYFQDLTKHAVPLDQRAVAALSHSAMALDIYAWLAQRLYRIDRQYPITWKSLHQQFGYGYKEIRQFRSAFLKTLKDVQMQYPEAQIEANAGGLILRNSPPPVRRKLLQITGS